MGGRSVCSNTSSPSRQAVSDLLGVGRDNAQTARDLAAVLGWSPREVTREIEIERREGVPILAEAAARPGYYLPSNDQDWDRYIKSLAHRSREVRRTLAALTATRARLAGQQGIDFAGGASDA